MPFKSKSIKILVIFQLLFAVCYLFLGDWQVLAVDDSFYDSLAINSDPTSIPKHPGGGGLVIPAPNGIAGSDSGTSTYSFMNSDNFGQSLATQGTLREIIVYWTNFFIGFVAAVLLLYILYAGYQGLTAYGDSAKARSSLTIIWKAVLGLMIIFAAYAIVNTLLSELWTGG